MSYVFNGVLEIFCRLETVSDWIEAKSQLSFGVHTESDRNKLVVHKPKSWSPYWSPLWSPHGFSLGVVCKRHETAGFKARKGAVAYQSFDDGGCEFAEPCRNASEGFLSPPNNPECFEDEGLQLDIVLQGLRHSQ